MKFIASAIVNLTSAGSSNVSKHRIETRKQAFKETWSKFNLNHEAMLTKNQLTSHENEILFQEEHVQVIWGYKGYLGALETNEFKKMRQARSGSPSMFGPTASVSKFSDFWWITIKSFRFIKIVSNQNLTGLEASTESEWLPQLISLKIQL